MLSPLLLEAVLVAAAIVLAPAVASADDNMKRGIELYKAGKYADAAAALAKAYDADGKPETLFALAQAERLAGDCKNAAPHYHKVLDQVSDLNVAKLVQAQLSQCEKDEPAKAEPAKVEPKPEPAKDAPPPQIVTKTVVREVHRGDQLSTSMFATGMLCLGGAAGLLVASLGSQSAADAATTQPDYNRFSSRASTEGVAAIVTAAAGATLITFATVRWLRAGNRAKADVAIVPTASGGALVVGGRF